MAKKSFLSYFNPNWIAAAILLGAFITSAVRFYHISGKSSSSEEVDSNVILVAHWQLEPGFRESLQWAIDEYNSLPEVQASGIRVEQTAIPQNVYNQFMNVHLISGTAPDIAVNGNKVSQGSALAKFYTPLGNYTEQPNPFNAPEYQRDDLDPDVANFIEQASWRDTFFDGLQGGYNPTLGDYYGIPVSTFGGARFFYNLSILHEVKKFAAAEFDSDPQPEWMRALWTDDSNRDGFLPEAAAQQWLQDDSIPQSLGELVFYCFAIQAYSESHDRSYLVPVAGSKYAANDIAQAYRTSFFTYGWDQFTLETGTTLSGVEALAAFEEGLWDFNSPNVVEYFNLTRIFAEFYPTGFLGLDREQAQRRFALGQAAIIYTGAWDAPGIFSGAKNRDNPEDAFEIAIAAPPLPRENERWAEYVPFRISEADVRGGVPFAINQQSPHFDRALNFLQFLTSHRVNEAFNKKSGWLPVIDGAEASDLIADFSPKAEGLPKNLSISLWSGLPSSITNTWTANLKLYMTGDISYEEFSEKVRDVLANDTIGIRRAWIFAQQQAADQARSNNRTNSVEHLNTLLGVDQALDREIAITYLNLVKDEGIQILRWWNLLHPDQPFPSF